MEESDARIVVLSPDEFNTGVPPETVPEKERAIMNGLQEEMKASGFDLVRLYMEIGKILRPNKKSPENAKLLFRRLHDSACVLFLHWSDAHRRRDGDVERATARLFNLVTLIARKLDGEYNLVDRSHIDRLENYVKKDLQMERIGRAIETEYVYDPESIANELRIAAKGHTHEKAWIWVVLPTYPKQHYGRILLRTIKLYETKDLVLIVQPTFTDGEATLFHTHGQNWGFSCPLGQNGENRHINTMWQLHSDTQLFPLKQLPKEMGGNTFYYSGDIAIIPPKSIHGIAGARTKSPHMQLKKFAELSEKERRETIEGVRFGENSCLHIYKMEVSVSNEFEKVPVEMIPGKPEKDFFEKNDMIVFDHINKRVWSGSGGAWERRMLTFGPTGEHCGICFKENDTRRENIPDELVLKRFVNHNYEPPIIIRANGV